MKTHRIMCWILVIMIVFTASLGTAARSTEAGEIKDAKDAELALRQKKAKMQEKKAKLKQERENLLLYIADLDASLEEVEGNILELNGKIKEKKEYIEVLQGEVDRLQKESDEQYDTMKQRIKYMYENGNREYTELILSAESFSEMLNRAEYVSKITQYDNELLEEYIALLEELEGKKTLAEDQMEQLRILKEEKKYDRKTIRELRYEKNKELEKYNTNIESASESIKKYSEKIREQEELVEKLLEEEWKKIEEEQKRLEEERNLNSEDGFGDDTDESGDGNDEGSLFAWPLEIQGVISGHFGAREVPIAGASPDHNGLDIAAPKNTQILAAASGKVVISRYSSTAGNYIMIYHGGSTYTVYMHASGRLVEEGQEVYRGQTIGLVGSTGLSTGPHLHFGVSVDGSYVDPLDYLGQFESED